jgi:T-box protein 20
MENKLKWNYDFEKFNWNSITGPASIDRYPEGGEDELDVDVEQCSDSEAPSRSRTPRTASNNSRGTSPSPSDEERLTPEPVRNFKNKFIIIY